MVLPSTYDKTNGLCMPCFKKPQKEALSKQYADDLRDRDLIEAGRQRYERMIGCQHKEDALKRFSTAYSSLLSFLSENGLLKEPVDPSAITNWYDFEMRYSMLTEKGIKLFDICYIKWLEGHDRGTKLDYLGQWKKHLREL